MKVCEVKQHWSGGWAGADDLESLTNSSSLYRCFSVPCSVIPPALSHSFSSYRPAEPHVSRIRRRPSVRCGDFFYAGLLLVMVPIGNCVTAGPVVGLLVRYLAELSAVWGVRCSWTGPTRERLIAAGHSSAVPFLRRARLSVHLFQRSSSSS